MRYAAFVFIVLASACARPAPRLEAVAPERSAASAHDDLTRASCDRRGHHPLYARAGDIRQGNAIALVSSADHVVAYVADADSQAIHTVALDDARELGHTRLRGAPRQLLILADGRVVATLVDAGRLVVLEPGEDPSAPMTVLCERALPAEPWGIARNADETTLAVTSVWGAALTTLDAKTFAVRRSVPLARDPRSVVIDDRGVAFVSHAVGARLSAIDLARDASPIVVDAWMRKTTPLAEAGDKKFARTGSQGFALALAHVPVGKVTEARVLAPMTSVDPGAFGDSARASKTYYGPPFDGVPKQAPTVAVVDPVEKRALSHDLIGTTKDLYRGECLLPRSAVARDESGSLFVACAGVDAVLELDARAVDPIRAERRRFTVAPDPEGLAIDERGKRLVVFSELGATLTLHPLDDRKAPAIAIALDYRPDPAIAKVARGRQLFSRTDDARIANDGLACASCHIDGRDDGITWSTPNGPRQTPLLAGRLAGTAPYGWEGDRPSLESHIEQTVGNLGGTGLPQADLASIAAFLLATRPPPSDAHQAEGELTSRGAAVFEQSGCETCHAGGRTDDTRHVLGQTMTGDTLRLGVDTPSLRFVGGSAPYFHDGRYPTLEDLLADPKSRMGTSAALSPEDRNALAAYLRSL